MEIERENGWYWVIERNRDDPVPMYFYMRPSGNPCWNTYGHKTGGCIGDGQFSWIGPRIDPPPLPKKEEPPKGVEAADALMAIFGYERVETKGNEVRYKEK